MRGGIIAIKLKEDDELVDVAVTQKGDEVVLSTKHGMAIRFNEADARPMGRNTSGVKGISLASDDELVGMVVADPDATLLTACENGYGKRTPFGPNSGEPPASAGDEAIADDSLAHDMDAAPEPDVPEPADAEEGEGADAGSSSHRYRTQRRGGKGLRDIKTTDRNGPVVGVVSVRNEDEVLMMTSRGKIQRLVAGDISLIGRNTQGVRIMSLDEADTLAAVVRVPSDEAEGETTPTDETPELPAEPAS
jgi:DNA gyrase subunit A